jgi:hypothetical protein
MTLAAASPSACATEDAVGGLNAPCERENDCVSGLSCSRGVCTSTTETGPEGVPEEDGNVADGDGGSG